ncbi:hypothetical protein SAMN04489729_3270 [Amycolatopsis lurida]|nr:hypothetical protein SAMN04489729_3270 [Amycolatopsis lurida]
MEALRTVRAEKLLELDDDEVLALLGNDSRLERKVDDVTTELAHKKVE